MFDQIGRVAEQVATSVSRRRFLGSVGRWAGATALALAGFLTARPARGGRIKTGICCVYSSPGVLSTVAAFFEGTTSCPPTCCNRSLVYHSSHGVSSCSDCIALNPGIETSCKGCPNNCFQK